MMVAFIFMAIFLIFCTIFAFEEISSTAGWFMVGLTAAAMSGVWQYGGVKYEEQKAAKDATQKAEDAAWVANHCPMIAQECGSKAKFACEVRVPTIGKYVVDNYYVQSYPTCVPK